MDTILEILQTMRRNKFRTAMTGFAVSWGIFILVVLMGASSGLQHGILRILSSTVDNAVTIHSGWTQMPYEGLPVNRQMTFTDKEYRLLKQSPLVDRISPVARTSVTARFKQQTTNISLHGVNTDYVHIQNMDMIAGRFLSERDFRDNRKVVVLNKLAINELANGDSSIVGEYMVIGTIFFRVIGVVDAGRWGAQAYIPLNIHQRIYSTDHHADMISLTLNNAYKSALANDTVPVSTRLKHLLSPSMRFHPDDPSAIWVDVKEESMKDMNNFVSVLQMLIIIISICTLISGAVGVSNIMLVSVKERTKELGIRKALGAPPAMVMRSVVTEALTITIMFGAIGIVFGAAVVKVIAMMTAMSDGNAPFENPTVDVGVVMLALAILVVVGVIAGAIPAFRAMNVRPIEALNYEK